jgi:hypothetical protein
LPSRTVICRRSKSRSFTRSRSFYAQPKRFDEAQAGSVEQARDEGVWALHGREHGAGFLGGEDDGHVARALGGGDGLERPGSRSSTSS